MPQKCYLLFRNNRDSLSIHGIYQDPIGGQIGPRNERPLEVSIFPMADESKPTVRPP